MPAELEYAIDIVSISKRFRRSAVGSYTTLKSFFLSLFSFNGKSEGGDCKEKEKFTQAIADLTIRIPRGASLGIIGKNGSGKSTFLKLITGIYKPDVGTIDLNGRVSALIELGAGFHPDFTGRENLYLGGIIHGLTKKEIDKRFDEIVRFAELEDYIDEPVRTYSSGMFMRLGFSLAVHTDPDILLVDEVLSVGDAGFVAKCKDKITELKKNGVTLLLVTHDMGAVERWCDEVLWLNKGLVMERGEPKRVLAAYMSHIEKAEERDLEEQELKAKELEDQADAIAQGLEVKEPERWGSREVEIVGVQLLGDENEEHLLYHSDSSLTVEIEYKVHQEGLKDLAFGIGIHKNDGKLMFGTNTDIEGIELPPLGETGKLTCSFDRIGFLDGKYLLDVAVHRSDGYAYDYRKHVSTFAIRWHKDQLGACVPPHSWKLEVTGNAADIKEWRTHE